MNIHPGWSLTLMMLSAVANELIIDAIVVGWVFNWLDRTDGFTWGATAATYLSLYAQGRWLRKHAGLPL